MVYKTEVASDMPQQRNVYDCGVYVCARMEALVTKKTMEANMTRVQARMLVKLVRSSSRYTIDSYPFHLLCTAPGTYPPVYWPRLKGFDQVYRPSVHLC